ncbi:MAG: phospholipase [Myxococcaceae bacterium]|nr:phospholipase [Myxococcaceae bacterium]
MHTTLGSLQCTVLPEADPHLPCRAVVVLCHGYGAPGNDLVGLHGELLTLKPSLSQVRFIFPQAPLSLADMGMDGNARAWWHLDMERIVQLQRTADAAAIEELETSEPEGLPHARQLLLKLLDEVTRQTQLPYSRVILGGFSQGAMLTTDVTLRLEEAPLGLAILSGTLMSRDTWARKAKSRAGLHVFQSHGTQDPILPYVAATHLSALLTAQGLTVDFTSFEGGHGIGLAALRNLSKYLDFIVAALPA